ncbi:MAG: hypothetical protein RRY29_02420 [Desulfovibrionaceae bacterium]
MKSKIIYIFLAIAATLVLCSCNKQQTKPQTIEDYNLTQAMDECKTSASAMNDGAKNSSNPLWDSYFQMCMNSKGYKPADYKHMWY